MLVGAIPGDQVLLSNVLTATWPICALVGIRSSHTAFWRSPLAVWAVVAMASVVIARWFLSTATVTVFLSVWTFGFIVAAIWWYRVSRWDTYLSPSIQTKTPARSDVIVTVPDQDAKRPTPWYLRWPIVLGGLGAIVLVPLGFFVIDQSGNDPFENLNAESRALCLEYNQLMATASSGQWTDSQLLSAIQVLEPKAQEVNRMIGFQIAMMRTPTNDGLSDSDTILRSHNRIATLCSAYGVDVPRV